MYRIRELVHETFQRNNRYIDTRELIKSKFDGGEFLYELNVELHMLENNDLPLDDEYIEWENIKWEDTDWEKIDSKFDDDLELRDENELIWEDYENFRNKIFNILIIEKNIDISAQIADTLKRKTEIVLKCKSSDNMEKLAETFNPDIICTELESIETWDRLRTALPNKRLGIIVTTTNDEENRLIQKAIKSGIPISSFVSINELDWINSFLTKLNNEKQRVFLGKIVDSSPNLKEPIVEILKGSNLSEGKLILQVKGEKFKPNKSKQAKILGYLLQNPGTLVSLDTIKRDVLGINKTVADNYLNKLVSRIRTQIQENWLKTDNRELAMQILESSAKGIKLNVQVINTKAN